MKKFFATIVMVCLIGAFSNQAMAQGPRRDNGRPGQTPAAVHQTAPAPGNHVNAVPAPRPAAQPAPPQAPRHAQPAPPQAPRHAQPAPPQVPRHAKPAPPPRHAKPLPPPPRHGKPVPPPPPAPHHDRPLPPPEPVPPAPRPVIDYRPGVGLYIGGEHFGITIPL